ncbi:UNVERIFIED_ORG: hypothetical protein QQG_5072 [Clostridioides difficile Y384]
MYLSIIFKLKMYKNTYIQLDIGIRGFQWWIRFIGITPTIRFII